eukprot:3169292-Amphidinium_carterae.1
MAMALYPPVQLSQTISQVLQNVVALLKCSAVKRLIKDAYCGIAALGPNEFAAKTTKCLLENFLLLVSLGQRESTFAFKPKRHHRKQFQVGSKLFQAPGSQDSSQKPNLTM